MRLRHADRKPAQSRSGQAVGGRLRGRRQLDPGGAVCLCGDRGDLLFDRVVQRVEEVDLGRGGCGRDDCFRQRRRAFASLLEPVVDLRRRTELVREPANRLDLPWIVSGEPVDGNNAFEAEASDETDVRRQIRRAAFDCLDAALRVAAVVLERLRRRDDDGGAGTRSAARQTMSTSFSKPMSDPNPLSVTT